MSPPRPISPQQPSPALVPLEIPTQPATPARPLVTRRHTAATLPPPTTPPRIPLPRLPSSPSFAATTDIARQQAAAASRAERNSLQTFDHLARLFRSGASHETNTAIEGDETSRQELDTKVGEALQTAWSRAADANALRRGPTPPGVVRSAVLPTMGALLMSAANEMHSTWRDEDMADGFDCFDAEHTTHLLRLIQDVLALNASERGELVRTYPADVRQRVMRIAVGCIVRNCPEKSVGPWILSQEALEDRQAWRMHFPLDAICEGNILTLLQSLRASSSDMQSSSGHSLLWPRAADFNTRWTQLATWLDGDGTQQSPSPRLW